MRLLAVLALAALSGCAGLQPPPRGPVTSTQRMLAASPPSAALDSLVTWATRADDLSAERTETTVTLRDLRRGQNSQTTVDAATYVDGVSELTVTAVATPTRDARSLFMATVREREVGDESAPSWLFFLPLPGHAECVSPGSWIEDHAAPPAPSALEPGEEVAEVAPELIGGMAGLQQRVEYPEALRRAGVEGQVLVRFIVGEEGEITCAEPLTSPHPLMTASAMAAVLASRFTPGTQAGVPVPIVYTVPIRFGLR